MDKRDKSESFDCTPWFPWFAIQFILIVAENDQAALGSQCALPRDEKRDMLCSAQAPTHVRAFFWTVSDHGGSTLTRA